ncbi:hypothetical protein SRABI106_03393 [Rahnella aquatilis]|nr:hypothetical protein SRABI106_03393 [Rahnella aquatilis]
MIFARQPRRLNKIALTQANGQTANITGEERNIHHRDGVKRIEQSGTQHRDDHQRQQYIREGHQHIDQAHQQAVGFTSGIPGDQTNQCTEQCGQQRGANSHCQ